jgi:hypothetical protein
MTHYHVNAYGGDAKPVASMDHVYRRRSDADDALADAHVRAKRMDTPFSPEDLDGEEVRECDNPACIGEDGP